MIEIKDVNGKVLVTVCADTLVRVHLEEAHLAEAHLEGVHLEEAHLAEAYLAGANLEGANLEGANLERANLAGANLAGAHLERANLAGANLERANLAGANLAWAHLEGAYLAWANLAGANLSGATGLLDPAQWLKGNFEQTPDGVIAYKTFGSEHTSPAMWKIEPGAEIREVVNPCRTIACACGVNVATRAWVDKNNDGKRPVWKVLIPWLELAGAVVPYSTDGKFRVGMARLLEVVQ